MRLAPPPPKKRISRTKTEDVAPVQKVGGIPVTFKGVATEEQIAKWKAEYKQGIYAVVVAPDYVGYFSSPTRAELNLALSKQDAAHPLAAYETFAELTWLGGAEEILKDDMLFNSLTNGMSEKLHGVQVMLVNQ